MKLLRFLLRCSKSIRHARIILVLVIIAGIVGGASTTLFLAIINTAITNRGASLRGVILSFVAIALLGIISRGISQLLLARFTIGAVFDLRMQLCRQILAVPYRKLEESGSHRLFAALTDDLPTIIAALSSVPTLCTQAAIVVCSAIYLAWLSWSVFLVLAIVMGVGTFLYQMATRRGLRHMKVVREEWAELLKHFRGLIDGTKELKLHRERRIDFLSRSLGATSASLRHHRIQSTHTFIFADFWVQVVATSILGLLLFGLPAINSLDAHVLTGYTLVFFYMLGPLQGVLGSLPGMGQATIAVNKVEELGLLLASNASESDSKARLGQSSRWRRLELAGVTHSYHREKEDSRFILGPIDVTIHPGELVFVTGGNGSGKTTLVKLLTGLYEPEGGEIRLDGEVITSENRDDYRQHFSVVFSDFYLFDSFFGMISPDLDAQALDYLIELQLDHKVQVNDGKLSTTDLSQGQRKRLALLTAYLEARSIYVFDEWAADQDPQFKEIFYYKLLPDLKARGKTVIVISHDDRYFHVADRMIKLEYGKRISGEYVSHLPLRAIDLPVSLG
ncbi:MAG TPA: cyclic peptide export ABC transporter [Pyrinomonadaceae bacterium]|nr:cyclic peptide export ABC transporter [Pyrinomonadaceae bacterium]